MDDRRVVEVQIERPTRSPVLVERRCHLGLPIVIEVPPILDDGTPFPTSHWLTCPLAVVRVSRMESAGGVRQADELIASDPQVESAWNAAMERYETVRDRRIPEGWSGPTPSGGIAGSKAGVKCLHAQYGDHAAGNDNPIGTLVARSVEPLNCGVPCVIEHADVEMANPDWSEPPPEFSQQPQRPWLDPPGGMEAPDSGPALR